MNQKEFESVIKQPSNIRYEYFIKKVADYEEVWGLYDDGWATARDIEILTMNNIVKECTYETGALIQ